MNFKLNRALKSALLVGALVVGAAPAAFADLTQTDINALTPAQFAVGDNQSLSFNLYSTNTAAGFYSLTQNLGLTLSQVFNTLNTEMSAGDPDFNVDAPGTTLTFTIGNFGSDPVFASLLSSGQLAWTVAAGSLGSVASANSAQVAITVDQAQTAFTGMVSNNLISLTNNVLNQNYAAFNGSATTYPLAILTAEGPGYNSVADFNPSVLDSSTGVGGTMNFYGLSNNLSGVPDSFKYAGTWAFNIVSGIGQLVYSVPGGSEVPLPAAVWLLLSGLAGVGVVGRRKPATLAA